MDGEPRSYQSGASVSISSSSASTKINPAPLNETVDKLKDLLRKETHSHKETGHCYNTLQLEYDDLLRKYAEAENTIDKLRIGARIKLYYDPQQRYDDTIFEAGTARCKSAQLVHLMAQPQKAHLSRTYSVPENLPSKKDGGGKSEAHDDDEETQLANRIQLLQKDVTNFHTLLSSSDDSSECQHPPLDGEQQKEICDALKSEYEGIKNMLKSLENKQANGDTKRIRAYSTNSRLSEDFAGGGNNLQTEVYRLGLRLEEIDEEIADQLRRQKEENHDAEYENDLLRLNSSSKDHVDHHPKDRNVSGSSQQSRQSNVRHKVVSVTTGEPNGESGYFTGRSLPVPSTNSKNENVFEQKYLSQSLHRPRSSTTTATAAAPPYTTGDRVESWVSQSNQSAAALIRMNPSSFSGNQSDCVVPSSSNEELRMNRRRRRRRTRSSEVSSEKSSPSVAGHQRSCTHHSNTMQQPPVVDNNIKTKLATPTTNNNGRPFTHNSTEDSGFADHRSQHNIMPSQQTSPTPTPSSSCRRYQQQHVGNMSWNDASCSELSPSSSSMLLADEEAGRARTSSVPTETALSEGEKYRRRLQSLDDFVRKKKRSNNPNHNNHENGKEEEMRHSRRSPLPTSPGSTTGDTLKVMTSPPRHFDNSRHSPKNYSHHHKVRNETAEKEIEEEDVADDNQYLYDDDFADVSSSPNKSHFEKLQNEVHDIRNLVVDLRSSLDLKEMNRQQHQQHQSRKQSHHQRSETTTTADSPRRNKHASSQNHTTKASSTSTQMLAKKQLEMLERLNETIEQLSNKVVFVEEEERQQHSTLPIGTSSRRSPSRLYVSRGFDGTRHHSTLNTTTSIKQNIDVEEQLTPRLERLNTQVDRLHNTVATTPATPRQQQHNNGRSVEDRSLLLQHQSNLVKNLENKLNGLESRLDDNNNKNRNTRTALAKNFSLPIGHPKLSSTKYIESVSPTHTPKVTQQQRHRNTQHNKINQHSTSTPGVVGGGTLHFQASPTDNINNNVIHHYHSFHRTLPEILDDLVDDPNYPNHHHSRNNLSRSFAKPYTTHSFNKSTEPDALYESINSATIAAKRMEDLSKRMLSTMASDLYNVNEMNEY